MLVIFYLFCHGSRSRNVRRFMLISLLSVCLLQRRCDIFCMLIPTYVSTLGFLNLCTLAFGASARELLHNLGLHCLPYNPIWGVTSVSAQFRISFGPISCCVLPAHFQAFGRALPQLRSNLGTCFRLIWVCFRISFGSVSPRLFGLESCVGRVRSCSVVGRVRQAFRVYFWAWCVSGEYLLAGSAPLPRAPATESWPEGRFKENPAIISDELHVYVGKIIIIEPRVGWASEYGSALLTFKNKKSKGGLYGRCI
jgi:hypothetical protein